MSTADSTAAFFAKKKKKKAFKGFNANLIDASTVTSTVHVDAPAVSTDPSNLSLAAVSLDDSQEQTAAEQWDDEALAAATSRKGAVAGAAGSTSHQKETAELLDMKALDTKRREQDDIAEKLRVEETKAALAAAREGMEREAERLKEAAEQKDAEAAAKTTARFGAAAATSSIGSTGGRWVAPHLRAGTAASLTRSRMGGGTSQKLDTKDENLFPDLAAADAILEHQQKHEQTAYKVPKKTPVGGGATWGSRPAVSRPATAAAPKEEPAPEPPKEEEPKQAEAPVPAPATAPVAPKPVKPAGTGLKKKKKDLSTFKPKAGG